VLWNTRDTSVPWIKALDDIYDEYYAAQPDVPRQHTGNWRLPFQVSIEYNHYCATNIHISMYIHKT
jgi:hypothetical protein